MLYDSVAQTATLTIFALFLSSGLAGVSGAPVFDVHVNVRDKPWVQSCGKPVASAQRPAAQRHSVHRTLKHVQTQLKVAQNQYRKELKDVREIYSQVTKELEEQYKLPWLPENQFEWYYKEVLCLDKSKKAQVALPKLHDTLQRYAITFHNLKIFELKADVNDPAPEKRNKVINGIYHEILRMLCEVETAILTLGIKLPLAHEEVIVTESPHWTKEADFTRMLVQDSGILRLYKLFLDDWSRALRNATAKGTGTCDPSKLPPYVAAPKKGKKNHQGNKNGGKKRVGVKKQKQGQRASETEGKKFSRPGKIPGKGPRRKFNGNRRKKNGINFNLPRRERSAHMQLW
ncbi:uncharacterized protein LOC105692942 isoform X2 [Athalia rosae]|uniref:uncharacterized protein LOC105692942 isoform X2 n=1 Tax=Athalia rosae TaxID=37344 RepID=UPI0020347CCF|nr:uncharacterized protein LOC105692942 isoform X2 [Athalia rosae]